MRFVLILFLATAPAFADTEPMPLFSTEAAAQRHCPDDQVVWLYLKPGVYYLKGSKRYGADTNGLYVCKGDADRGFEHPAPPEK